MLKSWIDGLASSPNPLCRAAVRTTRAMGYTRRFVLNPRSRSEQWTRIRHGAAHIQGATFSEPDRYPELFAACRDRLGKVKAPLVISFGCSTGEEAFTLAKYIPHAIIVGADINRWCLRHCERKNRNPLVSFLHTFSPEFGALTNVDAIFSMAVFQRPENRNRTGPTAHRGFPFARFEEEIARLDRKLRRGGVLFIDHADFRFEDTAVSAGYAPLEAPGNETWQDRPVFGPDNRLIGTGYRVRRAFIKQR